MNSPQQTLWRWSGVLSVSIYMLITSALILSPTLTNENILIALRLSSLTTAIPFWLIFVTKPMMRIANDLGIFLQENRRYLWLIATISHFIHLYQIFLYYQLGNSCPLSIWFVTSPLWIFMALFSILEIFKPQLLDDIYRLDNLKALRFFYSFSLWYIWLIFTFAFVLATIGKQLLFYNIPASILFVAGGIMYGILWWQNKKRSS